MKHSGERKCKTLQFSTMTTHQNIPIASCSPNRPRTPKNRNIYATQTDDITAQKHHSNNKSSEIKFSIRNYSVRKRSF